MKKLLSVVLCLLMIAALLPSVASADGDHYLEINETNFPDENFRNWIIENLPVSGDADSGYYMTEAQVQAVQHIECSGSGISSLQGIAYFTGLQKLFCSNNQLSVLNVSDNTELTYLCCDHNRLTWLDLSGNLNLKVDDMDIRDQSVPDQKGMISNAAYHYDMSQIIPIERLSNIVLNSDERLDLETGVVTFAQRPWTFKYNYRTGFGDLMMEVNVDLTAFDYEPADAKSGKCGDDLYWSFDEDTGALTITGSGEMWEDSLLHGWGHLKDAVRTLDIANGMTKIGEWAFCEFTCLSSVTIPESVTMIGSGAFQECTSLTSITIPDSVTEIGYHAFNRCSSLAEVTLPPNLTLIDAGMFCGTALKEITIPDGVTYIDTFAFCDCTCLENVTIPDSVIEISEEVFENCTALTSVTLGSGLESIGNYAFENCTALTSVTLGSGLESIGNYAFDNCTALENITISESLAEVGTDVFRNTAWWNAQADGLVYLDYVLLGYKGASPSNVTMKDGTRIIADGAFRGTNLSTVTIPDGVITIGSYAFNSCEGLTSITIPNSVVRIGSRAFSGCTGLTEITIPDGVTSINGGVFSDCTGLTEIMIPDSVTSIGGYAFYNCTGLTEIMIPDSVVRIGSRAFSGCESVEWVKLGNGLTTIDDYVFMDCAALKRIEIPNSVKSIGRGAFYRCTNLGMAVIPISVETIKWDAFDNCTSLTDVYYYGTEEQRSQIEIDPNNDSLLDASWHYIETSGWCGEYLEWSFDEKTGVLTISGNGEMDYQYSWIQPPWEPFLAEITAVELPDGLTDIAGEAFKGCSNLTAITIPDTVTAINWEAFSGCTALLGIDIPDGVTFIGWGAFSACTTLVEVMIPDSVTFIGEMAFYACDALTDVYYCGTEAQKEQIEIGEDNDPLLNATWHYISEPPVFKTQSLVLADSIGVNFFVELPEIDGIDWTESYMTFTIFGIDGCTERCDYDPDFTNSKGYYGFTCYINAAQLADTITATFHFGDDYTAEKMYSVKEYLGTYDEYRSIFDEKTQAMIEALADYGHYVQAFLAAQKNWTYGVEHEEMDKFYTASYDIDAIKAAAADFAIVRVNESNGDVEKITYSMAVDSATAILVYFKPAADYSGTLTVKVNGEDYTTTVVSGRYEVRIPDISAHQLGRTFTIVATTEHGTATAEVSALSYVAGSLNAYASVPLTANAMASIYRYAMAAEEYKN